MEKIEYPHAGCIKVDSGKSNLELFLHQEEAINSLNNKALFSEKKNFKGLLVLPTGAGKTLTAAYWLLNKFTDNNQKILWIAHRHELLEQAKKTFEALGYRDILKKKDSFNYRIISGIHDRPVNIKPSDDIIISSKDSLNTGFEYLYENWIKHHPEDIYFVVDEAHHATAKTYRKLIKKIEKRSKQFRMLGLTATPFRTAEYEKGLLKLVFPDDIVYKTDLRTLIDRGILSEPIFYELKTNFDMTKFIDEAELKKIRSFDIDTIGGKIAKTIAENRERNHFIVQHYLENKSKYNQTIVFALNIDNAIAISKLFNDNGIKSDFVVSSIRTEGTGISISSKENKDKIHRFRQGEIEVLVNVNILTEGTDLPEVQTIFLARPTISTILMTQMIGRGLRGLKAGGTKKAYIINFIDDWKDKVSWVNPEKLFIEKNIDFIDKERETQNKIIRLISIKKIEEFAAIMDKFINTDEIESLEFIERIPVGIYSFKILKQFDGEEREKNCEILVYNNLIQAYADFINSLSDFFKENKISDKEYLTEEELESLSQKIEDEFFYGYEKYPGYIPEDLKDLLLFYAQKGVKPDFIKLEARDELDITTLAVEICEKDLGPRQKKKFLDEHWDRDKSKWKAFFGYNRKYFDTEIDLRIRKLVDTEIYNKKSGFRKDIKERRKLENLSLYELREWYPQYWRKLSDSVYEKYKDEEGYYFSAKSGFKSKSKINFQIDHIIPMSKGGLTKLNFLQLLTRKENAQKGSKIDLESLEKKLESLKKDLDELNKKSPKISEDVDKIMELERDINFIDRTLWKES